MNKIAVLLILLLKTIMLSKVFIANKVSGIESDNKSIIKFIKPIIKKLFNSLKLVKSKKGCQK